MATEENQTVAVETNPAQNLGIQLVTQRLIIRPAEIDEVSQFKIIDTNPDNVEFESLPLGASMNYVTEFKAQNRLGTRFRDIIVWHWAIVLKSNHIVYDLDVPGLRTRDGVMVGALMSDTRVIPEDRYKNVQAPKDKTVCEVGICIHAPFTRKGFAAEVFEGFFDFLFGVAGVDKLLLETQVDNGPFRGLMERFGSGDNVQFWETAAKPPPWDGDCVVFCFGTEDWESAKRGRVEPIPDPIPEPSLKPTLKPADESGQNPDYDPGCCNRGCSIM